MGAQSASRAERPGTWHAAAEAKERRDFRKRSCREEETKKTCSGRRGELSLLVKKPGGWKEEAGGRRGCWAAGATLAQLSVRQQYSRYRLGFLRAVTVYILGTEPNH